ncbi:type II toxin-antitoxin system Phd/YefM family antitoxin [Massilia glaciei]|uniref:Antitoxin n=1 Tax=Massilia glaciei TaxID=1524097 RepID=A0A2U2HK26_9BURK|nr:type II toxin-antitoxin system Phd/YefM family antitoxin [Massilia glaciei]PWF47776.1 type II toxin-antitoxin system Phd/YefM family antitoxin [Massilia glaciei]
MRYSEQIKPISYLKDNTAKVVSEITRTREPMIITQNGEATFVVRDIKSWEQDQETLALLKILALGRQQIEQGEFCSAESVFAELDKEMDGTADADMRRAE